jgi:hypothetical protein
MMKPPPSERHQNGFTEQQMRDMLPSPDLAEQFIDVVTALAGDDSAPKVFIAVTSHVVVVVVLLVVIRARRRASRC